MQTEPFSKALVVSIAAHVAILLTFSLGTRFFAGEPLEYQSAVRVDIVGLPEKATQLPDEITKKDVAPKELPKVEEKKPDPPAPQPMAVEKVKIDKKSPKLDSEAINLDKVKEKERAALQKLKTMAAFEKLANEEKFNESKDKAKKALEKIGSQPVRGNEISAGTELRGMTKLQHDAYIATVERHIKQFWALPEWLSKKNLKAKVRVRFDEYGKIIASEITNSSGNPSFDDVVLGAIQKANPVPVPPEKFVRVLKNDGILFGFPE